MVFGGTATFATHEFASIPGMEGGGMVSSHRIPKGEKEAKSGAAIVTRVYYTHLNNVLKIRNVGRAK